MLTGREKQEMLHFYEVLSGDGIVIALPNVIPRSNSADKNKERQSNVK